MGRLLLRFKLVVLDPGEWVPRPAGVQQALQIPGERKVRVVAQAVDPAKHVLDVGNVSAAVPAELPDRLLLLLAQGLGDEVAALRRWHVDHALRGGLLEDGREGGVSGDAGPFLFRRCVLACLDADLVVVLVEPELPVLGHAVVLGEVGVDPVREVGAAVPESSC